MKALRVLHLVSVRWYNACAHYALCMGKAMRGQGVEIFFAGLPGSPVLEKASQEGFQIAPGSFWRVRALIKEKGIHAVFSHRGEDHFTASLLNLFSRGRVRHIGVRADIRRPRNHALNRFFYRACADRHVVPSAFMRDYFKDLKVPPERVSVLPQPFDGKGFADRPARSPLRTRLDVADGEVLAGVIARLDPVKGHAVVMAAANLLAPESRIRFLVSGETCNVSPGDLQAMLTPAAAKRVLFMDRVPDVRELLHALDIGIVASTGSEAVCRVALEMAAAGLPVIGTNVHSVPEIITHEKGGLIIPPSDPRAMAGAVRRLAGDAILRSAMGRFNQRRVEEEYGLDAFGRKLADLCGGLL